MKLVINLKKSINLCLRSSQNGCPRPAQQSVYAKRKPINSQSEKYNYQHWLIQVS